MQVEIEVFGTSVRYYCCQSQGVDWVFVSHPSFKRIGLYGDAFGPFQDNQVRVCTSTALRTQTDLLVKGFQREQLKPASRAKL